MKFLPHELSEARALRAIPATVRRKLVESGAMISSQQWLGLPRLARQRLVNMEVEVPLDRKAFGRLVEWLKRTFLRVDEPYDGDPHREHPWRSSQPPPIVQMQPSTWCGLGVDARFALVTAKDERERNRILTALTGAVD